MFALLRKDFLLLRKERMVIFTFLLALALGVATGGASSGFFAAGTEMSVFILLFPAYIAVSYSNAYDFKYSCEPLLACLPPGRRAVVGSKYLLVTAANLVIIASALMRAAAAILGLGGVIFPWETYAVALGLSFFLAAVELAAYFRFGYMKARWVAIGAFAFAGALGGIIGGAAGSAGQATAARSLSSFAALASGNTAWISLAIGLAFFLLSFAYSRRIYGKREL